MVIDMHSHILPRADHGSKSLEQSIEQCKMATDAGIDTVVATPHFNMELESVDAFLARREGSYKCLTDMVGYPRIIKAAEVTLYPGLEHLSRLPELCIAGTDYILLEMPVSIGDEWAFNCIFHIEAYRGLHPIIAHIDRCGKEQTKKIFDTRAIVQANSVAFSSFRKCAMYKHLFKDFKVHVIGSDAHGISNEYLEFAKLRKKMGQAYDIAMANAERILNNELLSKRP